MNRLYNYANDREDFVQVVVKRVDMFVVIDDGILTSTLLCQNVLFSLL